MKNEIKHLAWLSRIEIKDEEVAELEKRLAPMKNLIDTILKANVENVPPLYHPAEKAGKLRDDEQQDSLDRERALSNAAKTENGYVVAPRTVEE